MFQSEWRACSKCNLLVHGEGEVGRCRVGGSPSPHRATGASYALAIDTPNAPGQHGWGACITCGAMVFGKGGPCPGSGAGHQPAATDYAVPHSGDGNGRRRARNSLSHAHRWSVSRVQPAR